MDILNWVVAIGVPALYLLGVASAADALMKTRTPQGTVAWMLALITIPLFALPLYWVFGRHHFAAYVRALRSFDDEVTEQLASVEIVPGRLLASVHDEPDERTRVEIKGFRSLATTPLLRGNRVGLLVDGEATFDAIFRGIDDAERYVLAQFYIVKDDELGRAFADRLAAAAERGVRVYLLYDEVGSHDLPDRYIRRLRDAGVSVSTFSRRRSFLKRFRLNFRNHRKIVVVDGGLGFMGGLNVADEYMGRHKTLTPWRDTHMSIEGPAVLGLQLSFLRDWYYGRQEVLEVDWPVDRHLADQRALVVASGPADRLETCALLYANAIDSAEERLWIATPYFVPDSHVMGALQLAALRGVDVRVIVPRTSDSTLFRFAPYAYLPEAERAGVKVFFHEPGFMHQKVLLVDDDYAAVSTANFDNRSFRLNFEVTCLVNEPAFCAEVERMLLADLERSTRVSEKDLTEKSFPFQFAVQATRLLAPVL